MAKKVEKPQTPTKEFLDSIVECALILILVALYIGISLMGFNRFHHGLVVVDGSSMYPTLNGNLEDGTSNVYYEYGKVDTSSSIFKYLDRFDIIACYYPSDYNDKGELYPEGDGQFNSSLKVKRICGFPNETIKIDAIRDNNGHYIRHMYITASTVEDNENPEIEYIDTTTNEVKLPYNVLEPAYYIRQPSRAHYEVTLGDDEYAVFGDNWDDSKDSRSVGPIKFNMLHGIMLEIDGKCTYDKATKTIVDYFPYKEKRVFK